MTRPNLFIIGAMKAGTTSLHAWLSAHPRIFMSEPKEPAFFVPELRSHPKDLDWYLGLFQGAARSTWVGEASTQYTKRPRFEGVPARIRAFAPDARLIYLMRDPVERALSDYWHRVRDMNEHRSMRRAFREEPLYRSYGDYRFQLEAYLDEFDRERILLLTFEDLVRDPSSTVRGVFRWLGVDPIHEEPRFEAHNVRPPSFARTRGGARLARLRESHAWRRVRGLVPRPLRRIASRMTVQPDARARDPDPRALEILRPWAEDRIAALSELLGRDFPEWRLRRLEQA